MKVYKGVTAESPKPSHDRVENRHVSVQRWSWDSWQASLRVMHPVNAATNGASKPVSQPAAATTSHGPTITKPHSTDYDNTCGAVHMPLITDTMTYQWYR